MVEMLALAAVVWSLLADPIFVDGFETPTLEGWGDRRGEVRIVDTDPFEGSRCLEFLAKPGKGTGGHLVHWFMPGFDAITVEWAVKFASDFDQGNHMHLCWVGGNRTDDRYSAFGKAGKRPSGTDFFVTNLEPWREWGRVPPPGTLGLYAYWPDMERSPDGMFWGNTLASDPKLQVPRGKWVRMRLAIRLNTPGRSDGEQAFWMDGTLGGHFKGLRFRDSDVLRLNSFALDLYVHDSVRDNRAWFDAVRIESGWRAPVKEGLR